MLITFNYIFINFGACQLQTWQKANSSISITDTHRATHDEHFMIEWSLHDFGWNTFRAWSQRNVAVVQEDLRAQLRKMEAGASDQQNVEAFYMVLNRVGSQHTQHTLLGLRRISTRLSTSYSSDENLTEFAGWQFLIQPWLEWQSLFNWQGATDVCGTCDWELLKEVWKAKQSSVSIATLWLLFAGRPPGSVAENGSRRFWSTEVGGGDVIVLSTSTSIGMHWYTIFFMFVLSFWNSWTSWWHFECVVSICFVENFRRIPSFCQDLLNKKWFFWNTSFA